MRIMSRNFARTLVWKHEYDVKLWRHKQRTPNTNDHHMSLNETPQENFLRTPLRPTDQLFHIFHTIFLFLTYLFLSISFKLGNKFWTCQLLFLQQMYLNVLLNVVWFIISEKVWLAQKLCRRLLTRTFVGRKNQVFSVASEKKLASASAF